MLKFLLPPAAVAAVAPAQQFVTVTFSAVVGDSPLACGQTYEGVEGSRSMTLVDSDGNQIRLMTCLDAASQDGLVERAPVGSRASAWSPTVIAS